MGKGIQIASSTLTTQINGRVYKVAYGDPQLQQQMLQFSMRLNAVSAEALLDGSKGYQWISDELHGFFVQFLGDEAVAEIFTERSRDVLGQLQLFAYLNEEINKVESVCALKERLGVYSKGQTK